MNMTQLAESYLALNHYSADSQAKIRTSAKLFDERADVSVECISDISIGVFREKTLAVAKPVTYNGYLRYLRLLGDYALLRGLITINWFRQARQATVVANPQIKFMDDDLINSLMHHIDQNGGRYDPDWFWRTVISLLFYTGIRRKQLVSMRMRDLDLAKSRLHLRAEGSKTTRAWSIPIHPILRDILARYLERVERDMGRPLAPNDAVFNARRHNPQYNESLENPGFMVPMAITDFFKRVNKHTGLGITPHRFRHTLATRLCNPDEGEPDLFAVQRLLGHTMIQTTRGYVNTPLTRIETVFSALQVPETLNFSRFK